MKFEIYADAYQWTNVQKRAKLCWAMTGTAGKYCSAIIRREKNIAFEELVNRMEKRFILCKLVATVQVQFNNARQSEIEDIDEWADRLLALALKAFRDLPDEYVIKQVVIKLCQGCIDKSIGSVAASFQPKSVEGALERIKWLQHSNQTIFGGTVRTKDPSNETDNTDVSVNVTKPEETTTKVMEKRMDSIKSVIQDTMKTVHENIDKVPIGNPQVSSGIGDFRRFWLSCLDHLFIAPKHLQLFGFPFFHMCPYLTKVIPEHFIHTKFDIYVFIVTALKFDTDYGENRYYFH